MAFPAKILCFLLLCFYLSHAREVGNSYFGKYFHSNAEDKAVPNKDLVSGKQETEPEPTFTPENHNGYGLYGREIDQGTRFSYSPGKRSREYNNDRLSNRTPFNNRENNLYEQNSMYDNNEVNEYNRDMNRFPVQKQGMSDTRFLENGKYFYDVNNEELYKNQYHNQDGRNNVFVPSRYRGENSRSQYNMEGMDENYQYQESQEEYVP